MKAYSKNTTVSKTLNTQISRINNTLQITTTRRETLEIQIEDSNKKDEIPVVKTFRLNGKTTKTITAPKKGLITITIL